MLATPLYSRPNCSAWLLDAVIIFSIGFIVIAGCSARSQRWPAATERATVVVRLDGKPAEGALVMLGPVGKGYAGQGTTAADGRAKLTTFQSGDGAVAGRYRVLVSWEEVRPNPAVKIPDPAIDLEAHRLALDAANRAGLSTHLKRQLLPQQYVSFETSGLDAEIVRGSANEVVLDLSSKVTPPPTKP